MRLGLDQETAEYCLVRVMIGDDGPDNLYRHTLSLIEELHQYGIPVVSEDIISRYVKLVGHHHDQEEQFEEDEFDDESDPNPDLIRLHYIAKARQALHVARITANDPDTIQYTWSAVTEVKAILREFSTSIDPEQTITESDIGLVGNELDHYPDPQVTIPGSTPIWTEWYQALELESNWLYPEN